MLFIGGVAIGIEVNAAKKEKIDKATTKIAGKLSVNKKPYVGIKTRFIFNMMGIMQKKDWSSSPVEKEYWQQKGWLGSARPWK